MISKLLQARNVKYAFSFFLIAILKHRYLMEIWLKFGEPLFSIKILQKFLFISLLLSCAVTFT